MFVCLVGLQIMIVLLCLWWNGNSAKLIVLVGASIKRKKKMYACVLASGAIF
jgi:hypothetical protein